MSNEAAERLRDYGTHATSRYPRSDYLRDLDAALAAERKEERKATVERIRAALITLAERYAAEHDLKPYAAAKEAIAILDAEGPRET